MKTKTINIRFDGYVLERLIYLCKKHNCTMSQYIRDLISREYFKEHQDSE